MFGYDVSDDFSTRVGKNVISLTNSAIRLQRHHPILSYALKRLKASRRIFEIFISIFLGSRVIIKTKHLTNILNLKLVVNTVNFMQ